MSWPSGEQGASSGKSPASTEVALARPAVRCRSTRDRTRHPAFGRPVVTRCSMPIWPCRRTPLALSGWPHEIRSPATIGCGTTERGPQTLLQHDRDRSARPQHSQTTTQPDRRTNQTQAPPRSQHMAPTTTGPVGTVAATSPRHRRETQPDGADRGGAGRGGGHVTAVRSPQRVDIRGVRPAETNQV
jgi:hypothetical protein